MIPPHLPKNTDAYRSGHNEAVLKTVWVQAHGGSNPSASAKTEHTLKGVLGFEQNETDILCENIFYSETG